MTQIANYARVGRLVSAKHTPRGGDRASYVEAGRRAGYIGEPNRKPSYKYSREPWQRTAYREGWAIGRAQRESERAKTTGATP